MSAPKSTRGKEAESSTPLVAASIMSKSLIPQTVFFKSKPLISFAITRSDVSLSTKEQKGKSYCNSSKRYISISQAAASSCPWVLPVTPIKENVISGIMQSPIS